MCCQPAVHGRMLAVQQVMEAFSEESIPRCPLLILWPQQTEGYYCLVGKAGLHEC